MYTMTHTLSVTNKRLHDYYSKNTSVNFETMNLILLDFLENLTVDMTQLLQSSFNGQLLTEVKELKQQLNSLQDNFTVKMSDNNKAFIDTLKDKLLVSGTENQEKLSQLLNRNTDLFIDKINSILPKTQDETNRKIQDHLSQVQRNIQFDIQQYLSNKTDTSLQDFISSFETKMLHLQSPILSLLHANQEHISTKIGSVKEDLLFTRSSTEQVCADLNKHLSKYSNSSQFKGMCAEIDFEQILTQAFSTYEVNKTNSQEHHGDFMLKKDDENFIMIELKNHTTNVDREEINKFLNNISFLKTHGIMVSNQTGIVGKPDFHIEIDDSCVLVYLHHVNFSPDKIKMAVSIIENLASKLKNIEKNELEDGYTIKKEVCDRINIELAQFIENKTKISQLLKDQHRQAIVQLDSLQLPDLALFLQDKYVLKPKRFACDMCDRTFDTRAQLAGHKKVHVRSSGAAEEPDIHHMSLPQLREEGRRRGLNTSGKNKAELITLLR